jgi:hypothetical protein
MPSITEVNETNAPTVRTDADALAGVTAPADAKTLRENARAAREAAKALSSTAAAAAKAEREARAAAPKKATARDFVRTLDAMILTYAGSAFDLMVAADPAAADGIPEELRAEVASLLSNQLHHLASPKTGWVGTLPVPNRSEWV